jgi:predicted outer membrane repeat protein
LFNNRASTYGGAICNDIGATLSVSDSTFALNSAINGGAISSYGILTVSNSAFSENQAESPAAGYGGGIDNTPGAKATVVNSTFFSNTAHSGGGGISSNGTLTVTNSTLAYNNAPAGAGLHNGGTGTLRNTIVASNLGDANCGGMTSITDGGYNLESSDTCGFNAANNSLPSTNPLVGPFGNHGGSVWTVALLPGSPAIDAADDATCPSTDARSIRRPVGAHCDIGAFEWFNASHFISLPAVRR